MRIIPVLDLMGGQVVRGVAGRRSEYRPIESRLTREPTPAAVAAAFAGRCYREAYLADLDAIAGVEPAWHAYEAVAATGLRLWVDAGVADVLRATELAARSIAGWPIDGIVLGLESMPDEAFVSRVAAEVDPLRLLFSFDLKDGRPITSCERFRDATAESIVEAVVASGITRIIVLDLARVGIGEGPGTEDICRRLHERFPTLEIIAGGGVRGPIDLQTMATCGCSAALVASALHDGRL